MFTHADFFMAINRAQVFGFPTLAAKLVALHDSFFPHETIAILQARATLARFNSTRQLRDL